MFESDLTKIALDHLSNVANEPNLSIRTAGTQILVELFVNSEPARAMWVIEILEKVTSYYHFLNYYLYYHTFVRTFPLTLAVNDGYENMLFNIQR